MMSDLNKKKDSGKDKEIRSTFVFKCKLKKFVGFKTPSKIYIVRHTDEDKVKIKDPEYIFKCLNTNQLINKFHFSDTSPKTPVIRSLTSVPVPKSDFLNSEVHVLKLDNPPPNIITSIRNYDFLIFDTLELKDYSRIHLLKSIKLKYYFKKLLTNEDKAIESLEANINTAINSSSKLNFNEVNVDNLTEYNNVLNKDYSDLIFNIYLFQKKIKKFNNLNKFLNLNIQSELNISDEILLEKTKTLEQLIVLYYVEVLNLFRNKSQTVQSWMDPTTSQIPLSNMYTSITYNMANKSGSKELIDLVKENYIVSNVNDDIPIYLFRQKTDYDSNRFSTSNKKLNLFEIRLWEADLFKLVKFLYKIDDEIYYKTVSNIEKCLFKLKCI